MVENQDQVNWAVRFIERARLEEEARRRTREEKERSSGRGAREPEIPCTVGIYLSYHRDVISPGRPQLHETDSPSPDTLRA